jgi:glycosyltransferase involved in cell wall biosynthesis
MNRVDPTIKEIASKSKFVFNLANHMETMGQDIILKAVNEIKNNKMKEIKFVIAGNDSSYSKLLRDYIRENDLEKNVIFLSTLNEDEKNYLMQESLFVIVAARTKIACSSVFAMEAMRYCKPILISKIGGHLEMIEEKKNGEFFENENHIDLSKKIEMFIEDEQIREKYGRFSKEIFKDRFIDEECFKTYIRYLEGSGLNKTPHAGEMEVKMQKG